MRYFLRHRDADVLSFEVNQVDDVLSSYRKICNVEVLQPNLVPVLAVLDSSASDEALADWIINRFSYNSSTKSGFQSSVAQKKISNYKTTDFFSLAEISLCLSLFDGYWIVSADDKFRLSWKDVCLYQKASESEYISFEEALVSRATRESRRLMFSPEFTTPGRTLKFWRRLEDSTYLLFKRQSERSFIVGGREAYSSFYISQIAQMFDFESVSYDIEELNNKVFSVCKAFTSEQVGCLTVRQYLKSLDQFKESRDYVIQKLEKLYGTENFEDLMLFDALVCIADRDLDSFSVLIDNETLRLLKPAPFSGLSHSFFNFIGKSDLDASQPMSVDQALLKFEESFLALGFSANEQLKPFVRERHRRILEELINFEFKKHRKHNLSDDWLETGSAFVQKRAQLALESLNNDLS